MIRFLGSRAKLADVPSFTFLAPRRALGFCFSTTVCNRYIQNRCGISYLAEKTSTELVLITLCNARGVGGRYIYMLQ